MFSPGYRAARGHGSFKKMDMVNTNVSRHCSGEKKTYNPPKVGLIGPQQFQVGGPVEQFMLRRGFVVDLCSFLTVLRHGILAEE